uniref:Follitropin subunit beta n=1 Tax=Meleagris gallopavo TaxID=9103 RepID=G1MS74_MELGA
MKTLNCYVLLFCWKAICCYSCELTNITIAVEREECELCITVNATWCSGYCFTRDPVYKYPPVSSVQQICTFKEVVYETVKIPGCGDHPESFYSYPVATACHCVPVFLRGRKIWGTKSRTVYMFEDYYKKKNNSQFAMLIMSRTMNVISRSPKRERQPLFIYLEINSQGGGGKKEDRGVSEQ